MGLVFHLYMVVLIQLHLTTMHWLTRMTVLVWQLCMGVQTLTQPIIVRLQTRMMVLVFRSSMVVRILRHLITTHLLIQTMGRVLQ